MELPSIFSSKGMPCRSKSRTMAPESACERSLNSGVICGAVTRRMTKAKNPMSAAVTAAIAANRAAPSDLRKSKKPCNAPPRVEHRVASRHPAIIARFMVSDWLTGAEAAVGQSLTPRAGCASYLLDDSAIGQKQNADLAAGDYRNVNKRALLPVLLDTCGAQAGQTMTVDRILPRQEFFDSECIAGARLLERQQTAAHSCDNFRLPSDHPALGTRRGKISDR